MVSISKRILQSLPVSFALATLFYLIGSAVQSAITAFPATTSALVAIVGFACPLGVALSKDVAEDEAKKVNP